MRGALVGVIGRGLGLVGLMALLALWHAAAHPVASTRDTIAIVAVGLLLVYGVFVRGSRRIVGRPPLAQRECAWERAREIDEGDASLGLLVVGWVPAGLFLALGLLLWPHMTDPNPALAAAWVVLGLPPFAVAWMFATSSWFDACRDTLARAELEADTRFRSYWSNIGR